MRYVFFCIVVSAIICMSIINYTLIEPAFKRKKDQRTKDSIEASIVHHLLGQREKELDSMLKGRLTELMKKERQLDSLIKENPKLLTR